jgi:hypothetical protein
MLPEFSGFISYEAGFIARAEKAVLVIDDAFEGVEVFLNDVPVGQKVAPRFVFDLSIALKPGDNRLRIEVATNLARKTDKMLGKTFSLYKKSPALMPSGIVGAVNVYLQ